MSSQTENTRNRILQATLDLLEASDGTGVRMTDIAKRAGISRQAVYLHFATRAELLVAATHFLDELKDSNARLAASRSALTGVERLNSFIEAWCGYIPEIYAVARALLAMHETDAEAAAAWDERMRDMREGCEAAIRALEADGRLTQDYGVDQATDILWTMLSVRNWQQLTVQCDWSQTRYVASQKSMARRLFVTN